MRGMLAAIALASALAPAAVAQVPPRELERAEAGAEALPELIISRRARLGLKVNLQARETDSVGAYVDLVTPGGPAADAGLRAGDVIIRIDGESLTESSPARAERTRSLPGLRLISLAARLEPGDTVTVEYRRGSARRTTSLVTDADQLVHLEASRLPRTMAMRVAPRPATGMRPMGVRPFEVPAPAFELFVAGELSELELAPLNAELGQYFGIGEGVLVINAPRGSPLKLRGGDVVLAVDGRRPESPLHLLRILRSYDGDEQFKLDIMRARKRESLTASLSALQER
ncbi:MAG TPA: PDZ domain-containing protein [Gemmatimonadales bacterium]|nr:PDZ domain-containing protein [Gemmatimonadales bacterium]